MPSGPPKTIASSTRIDAHDVTQRRLMDSRRTLHKTDPLDEVLRSEVGAEVHNLPSPEADQQPGGGDAEPLDTVVGALVGVSQLLLSGAEVLHLGDDLAGDLFDAAELSLEGLELLGGLDG